MDAIKFIYLTAVNAFLKIKIKWLLRYCRKSADEALEKIKKEAKKRGEL